MKKITYNRKDLIRKLSYKINMNRNDSKIIVENTHQTIHEKAYQLSLNTRIGGSENGCYKKADT